MRGPNIHLFFSPKNNFQELQLHQTLIFLSEILSIFPKKKCCVLVFFQKYAMTSVHKNPKIYVNIHYYIKNFEGLVIS